MEINDKVGIVCCSNGIIKKDEVKLKCLEATLIKMRLIPVFSDYIFVKESVFSGTQKQRAEALMEFYQDKEIKAIFDISGGDIANEILPYLDFEIIKKNKKLFWGYSDLTTIINAIYTKTSNESILYQVKNLVGKDSIEQKDNFLNLLLKQNNNLYDFKYQFIQGNLMEGIVVGGNVRCFLKLAGTKYWPNMNNKILLLEARGGMEAQMITYLSQLKQIGVFDKINGLILGTFTELESKNCSIFKLVKMYVSTDLPIIKTNEIGHGFDSKAIIIGQFKKFD